MIRSARAARWGEATRHKQERVFNIRLSLILGSFALITLFLIIHFDMLNVAIVVIAVVSFIALWKQSVTLKSFRADVDALTAFYRRMECRAEGLTLNEFTEEKNLSARERDLDLVGSHSVLAQVSECFSKEAQNQLRALLNREWVDTVERDRRKQFWTIMVSAPGVWRRWLVKGHRNSVDFGGRWDWVGVQEVLTEPFLPGRTALFTGVLLILNVVFWIRGIYEMNAHQNSHISLSLIVIYWLGTLITLSRTGNGYARALSVQSRLAPLQRLSRESLRALKSSSLLAGEFPLAASDEVGGATVQMERSCDLLSTASHPLIFLLFNALVPWTLVGCWFAERARVRLDRSVVHARKEWEEIELLASFAMVSIELNRFDLRSSSASVIAVGTGQDDSLKKRTISARGLIHPLLARSNVIGADLDWSAATNIVILSGSNMAGKSTFLRALAINFQLAQIGAPVFAKQFSVFQGQLMSSIRTTDSLGDGASYFYAEVARVKSIVDQVSDENYVLYVVDEMFRGTNTRERVDGCSQLLEKLSTHPRALGVVATHDLELAALPLKGLVNFHFREEVEGDRMKFSYRLEEGICPTTNALRVMRQMGLPIRPAT